MRSVGITAYPSIQYEPPPIRWCSLSAAVLGLAFASTTTGHVVAGRTFDRSSVGPARGSARGRTRCGPFHGDLQLLVGPPILSQSPAPLNGPPLVAPLTAVWFMAPPCFQGSVPLMSPPPEPADIAPRSMPLMVHLIPEPLIASPMPHRSGPLGAALGPTLGTTRDLNFVPASRSDAHRIAPVVLPAIISAIAPAIAPEIINPSDFRAMASLRISLL